MPPPNTPQGEVTGPASPALGSSIVELDYQSLEYVGPVDETLVCPICRLPLRSPVTTRCGHTFCAGCINEALEMRSICPLDRLSITSRRDYRPSPLILKEQLDRLRVKCPNRRCAYECDREHVQGHYERRCQFTPVRCPIAGCTKYVARRDAHVENGCLHEEFTCPFCGEEVMWAEREDHYDFRCNGATVRCEECGKDVVRHWLGKHQSQDCPEGHALCKWHAAGCQVKSKRRVVQEHERGCAYGVINRLVDQRAEDREMINDLTVRLALLEAASGRRRQPCERREPPNEPALANEAPPNLADTETAGPSNDEASLSLGVAVDNVARDGAWASQQDYMLAQFERIEGQLEDIRNQMMAMDSHQSLGLFQTTVRFSEQLAELGRRVALLSMYTTWLMDVQRQAYAQQRTGSTTTAGPPTAGISQTGDTSTTRAVSSESGVRYQAARPRSTSSGRGEHPPRL